MKKLFYDTETCGFYGLPVTIQYAFDEDPEIHIHHIWKSPISKTLELIDEFMQCDNIGFNLTFDHFHLCKIYTLFKLFTRKNPKLINVWPEDYIDFLADLEPEARYEDCLKPVSCLDIFLYARKGPLQSTMDRKDINIRRVPAALADKLAIKLEELIKLDDIYFARRKDKFAPKWIIKDIKGTADFKDVVLSFKASTSLKALASYVLKIHDDDILYFEDVEIDKKYNPIELGYAPFAKALSSFDKYWIGQIEKGGKTKTGKTWPAVIKHHIEHWYNNPKAQQYAKNDVKYTRMLYENFGRPASNDDDSVLACAVASVRWKGFNIDIPKLKELREKAAKLSQQYPIAPRQASKYIKEILSPVELVILDKAGGSTKRVVLEDLAKREPEPCLLCSAKGCDVCEGKGHIITQASIRAKNVLDARMAKKEKELYDKLIQAGRFHASFIIIGTLSSRMSGTDKLNPQGIKRTEEVRSCFTLADDGYVLCGGDFSGFEVVLAEAVYKDPDLRRDLLTCDKCNGEMLAENGPPKCIKCGSLDGKKIHAIFGEAVFPNLTYEQIKKSKGSKVMDYYERSKRGVFSQLYGGNADTMSRKIGINIEDAKAGELRWQKRYPGVAKARQRINDDFCSMRQPGGLGSRVEWHEPKDYVESLLGFRRYFTLENKICKALYQLANHPPKEWKEIQIKVMRRDRIQTAGGAVQSALFAAAFGIQGMNMRAAANHEIQSSGSQITKVLQRRIWDIQPSGYNKWLVQPMNIHDQVLTPTDPKIIKDVSRIVYETVESFRPMVPLIVLEWEEKMNSWAD